MIVDSSELHLSCLPASLQDPKYTNKIYINPQFRVNCTVLLKKCNIIRLPTE
jgi:hypothetical protein